ncbi:hypothetical protein [Legionella hackeliae]|uniref:LidA long coiled-coil domain-containing protein n=1 Tax=Legionella hackeliae TaxID=449 RepID=A0A0A8UQQ7_LEGHA|nr:hypothetical protein [Legionella hackeliae]KTD15455.1 Dot/Icm system substrate protein LidA [Legionella hackeliae]CEK11175.1 protein of unknown function [Legionella hackeliae]STX47940.1 Dot/Icm system substrate protein LidA [Legionella hackeliae]
MANSTKVDSTDALSGKRSDINKELDQKHTAIPTPPTKSQQESNESIALTTKENKVISLTASQLEKWFANLETSRTQKVKNDNPVSHVNDPELATIYLSRYGLKTSKDVITFLKSPAGHDVITMIGKQLAEIESIREAIQLEQRDHQIRRGRALAALLLGLLYEREAKAKEKNAEIQKGIDKKLHKPSATAMNAAEDMAAAEAQHAAYTESINALQNTLSDKLKESEKLEEELELAMQKLDEEDAIITSRYGIFDHHLDALDQYELLLKAFEMSPEQRTQTLTTLQQQITWLQEQVALSKDEHLTQRLVTLQTTYSILEKQTETPESTVGHLENKLKGFKKTLKTQAAQIGRLIEAGKDDEARELLHEHNGLHVQYEGLKDMISVLKGEKKLWNLNGQPMSPFTDFGESAFILSKDESIVFHNGKHYLLPKDQSPENFPFMSQEEQDKAQVRFERAKPSISSLKTLVHHNKGLEVGLQTQKRENITARSEAMQQEILLLSNQLTKLQAARADLEVLMNQLRKEAPEMAKSLTPVPTPQPSSKTSTNVVTQSYRHILLLMKSNPTQQSVSRLESIFRRPDGTVDPSTQALLANIRYGRPMPQQTINNLLKNMERLGISAYKPGVTSIPRPQETAHDDYVSSAPNPFSTTLSPFQKR